MTAVASLRSRPRIRIGACPGCVVRGSPEASGSDWCDNRGYECPAALVRGSNRRRCCDVGRHGCLPHPVVAPRSAARRRGRSDLQQVLDPKAVFWHPHPEYYDRWIGAGHPAATPPGRLVVPGARDRHQRRWRDRSATPPTGRWPGPVRCRARRWWRSSAPRCSFWLGLPGLDPAVDAQRPADRPHTRIAAWATVMGAVVAILRRDCAPIQRRLRIARCHPAIRSKSPRAPMCSTSFGGPGSCAVHLGVIVGGGGDRRAVRTGAGNGTAAIALARDGGDPVRAVRVRGIDRRRCWASNWLTDAMAGCLLSIIPLAVALSIEQYHLYDVDRLVSRAVTWVVLSAAVIGTYVVVVVFVGQSIGRAGDSAIPAVVATLAAASVAGLLRREDSGCTRPPLQSPPLRDARQCCARLRGSRRPA